MIKRKLPENYIEYEDLAFELKKKFGYNSIVVAYHLLNVFSIKAITSPEGIKFAGRPLPDGSIIVPLNVETVGDMMSKRLLEVFGE